MKKRDLLIEIGTEEMPARFVADAARQLAEKVEKWLSGERIGYERVHTYETPRRLAVLVSAVDEKQAERNDEVKGPAKKIAVDESGAWTKAALGFAKSNGVDPSELIFKEVNGVEYVYARKNEAGRDAAALLPELKQVIAGLAFPKNMRWGSHDLRYVRPIRWLVALYGEEVIEMEIAGVQANRITRGHRFLGQDVELRQPADYVNKLAEQYVIADADERRRMILDQLRALEQKQGWNIPVAEGLLDEIVHLVEYPTVLYGSFADEFLRIPREVLVTSMREHQRYFPVEDADGKLLPYFVTVRNGDTRSLENVVKGNEKVLRARLSDARFFYEEDQKRSIDECLKRLETIVFHEELGTIADKVRRIRLLAADIAGQLRVSGETAAQIDRIAAIAKFDLVTQMVGEFPELQGIMGEDYARKAGESDTVAKGIFEHYLPRFAGDILPASDQGAVVSLADKLDTIVGCFLIGIIPTGSQDPYALRRQAAGIVQILLQRGWKLSFSRLFASAVDGYAQQGHDKRSADEVMPDLFEFFSLRLKNVLQEEQVRYDVIDAVLAADLSLAVDVVNKAKALMEAVDKEEFKLTVEQFNRVYNLAQKAESAQTDPGLFREEAEQVLYQAHLSVSKQAEDLYRNGDMEGLLAALSTLSQPIHTFFDKVMVMAEDEQIRRNRLALLSGLARLIYGYADFTRLVFS